TGTGTGTGTGGVDTGTGASAGNGTGTGTVTTSGSGSSWSANIGTTAFEIDLFGRLRSLSRAALDRYFATEAGARATRLTLVGDVA
ncbi:transporter, partial [Klebsiella variicola subsp. variicola]